MNHISKSTELEANSFNKRTSERVKHGHIPDLRRVEPCDWFFNNVWRRPYLVDMVYGRIFRFAQKNLIGKKRLLEIGCGPGYLSLELARSGHDVLGIDISDESILTAREIAKENTYVDTFGNLNYVCADFINLDLPEKSFDGVCIFQTLHHFDDPDKVLKKVKHVLKDDGIIVINEPSRDIITKKDATLYALIRILLSCGGNWYEDIPIPQTENELDTYVIKCLKEYAEARDCGEPVQSAHDNLSHSSNMIPELRKNFVQIDYEDDYAFIPRMVGGLRFDSEDKVKCVAEFLKIVDCYATSYRLVEPGGFFFSGSVKKDQVK